MRSTFALACALQFLAGAAVAAPAAIPANLEKVTQKGEVTEYRLKTNGMPVLLVERHAAPVVTFMVVYHVGSRNEAPGNTGSAHLLEHMLFNKSTAHFGKATGNKTIQVALHEVGVDFGSTNMTTWNDRMNGYSTVPSDKLDLAMRIEADRMQTAKILDSERQPEMSVVRNEYEIGENNAEQALSKAVTAAAIVAHPYHWDTIGYRSDIEGVTTEKLQEHYKNYFWPDNSAAIIVGDFETGAALTMFNKYFGSMPKAPHPIPKVITEEPTQEGERRVTVSRPGSVSWLMMAYLRPGVLDRDWHALDVLSNILGSGRTARLYKAMVETGLAADVTVANYPLRDPYLFSPTAQLAPGASPAKAESTMRAVLAGVADKGATQSEVDRAVKGIEVGYFSNLDGVYSTADALGEAVASANWQWYVDYLDNVHKVTPADVQRVARKYLVPDHATVGLFIPKKDDGKTGVLEGGGGSPSLMGVAAPARRAPQAASRAGGTSGPLGGLLFTGIEASSVQGGASGAAASSGAGAPTGFASRTVHKEWPRRLVLDIYTNPSAPTVAISGLIRAGTITAPAGKPEVAAVTAEMLTRGTIRRNKEVISATLEDLGASLTIGADVYDVNINAYCMSRDLPTLLDLISDQLLHPAFPADELEKAKLQRKSAMLGQSENTGIRAREALYQMAYPEGNPVRPVPVLERAAAAAAVTMDDVKNFYRQRYTGGSLVLAVSGNVNADSVVAMVQKYFADLPEGDAPRFEHPRVEPVAPQQRVVTMKGKANMDLVYGMGSALRRTDPDYYPAVLANAAFGQDALTSRAGKRVRDTEGLTYNLFSRYLGSDLLEGIWVVDVAVAPQNLKKAMFSTLDEYKKFAAGGMTQEELDAQKGFFAGNFKVRLATNTGIAQQLVAAEKFGFGPGFLDSYPSQIQAVTLAQANDVIKRRFDPSKICTVVAGDLEALPTP